MNSLITIFADIDDPRDCNSGHDLSAMLFIALAATLCGAKSCVEIADFAALNQAELAEIVDLPHGQPRQLQQQPPITRFQIVDRTLEPPIPGAARTDRAFITPCCTASVTEFLVDGRLWFAGSIAGHGRTNPWPGSIDDINDTGTLVDVNGTEQPIHWRPAPGDMN